MNIWNSNPYPETSWKHNEMNSLKMTDINTLGRQAQQAARAKLSQLDDVIHAASAAGSHVQLEGNCTKLHQMLFTQEQKAQTGLWAAIRCWFHDLFKFAPTAPRGPEPLVLSSLLNRIEQARNALSRDNVILEQDAEELKTHTQALRDAVREGQAAESLGVALIGVPIVVLYYMVDYVS